MVVVKVYGTSRCEHTRAARELLKALAVPYDYVDIDSDEAAAKQVEDWNDGRRPTPAVALLSGERLTVLSDPTGEQLEAELTRLGGLAEAAPPSPS